MKIGKWGKENATCLCLWSREYHALVLSVPPEDDAENVLGLHAWRVVKKLGNFQAAGPGLIVAFGIKTSCALGAGRQKPLICSLKL